MNDLYLVASWQLTPIKLTFPSPASLIGHTELEDKMSTLTLSSLPEPLPGVHRQLEPSFGRLVSGVDLSNLSEEEIEEIQKALYTHSLLLFPKVKVSPEKQYALTRSFDPVSDTYGHGNTGRQKESILHPDLKTVPRQPQVQVIGNGSVASHEGLKDVSSIFIYSHCSSHADKKAAHLDQAKAPASFHIPQDQNTWRAR